MKKPVLAAMGLAGACVACCTIPLAIPLFGGAAALGLTSWLGMNFQIGLEILMFILIATVALGMGGAMAWKRWRRAKACSGEPTPGVACDLKPDAPACGCAPKQGSMA